MNQTPATYGGGEATSASTQTELADLLACVAAFGRSLQETFDPQHFLVEFSSRARRLIPHDRMLIACIEDGRRSYTVFAESRGHGPPLHEGRYTTDFDPGGRYAIDEWDLESVFEGRVLLLEDVRSDVRWADRPAARDRLLRVGVRARVGVPLYAGGRVIGALVLGSFTPGTYTEDHAAACRQVADLIGPFVENVVLLHRERRRRRRLHAVAMLAPVLGGSLKVGDLVERLREAVRPVLDFDRMSVRMTRENGRDFERVGGVEDEVSPSACPAGTGPALCRHISDSGHEPPSAPPPALDPASSALRAALDLRAGRLDPYTRGASFQTVPSGRCR